MGRGIKNILYNHGIKKIRKSKIVARLVVVYIVICIIPIGIISFFYYQKYRETITEKLGYNTQQMLSLLEDNHLNKIGNIEYLINDLAYNLVVQDLLENGISEKSKLSEHNLQRDINEVVSSNMIISETVKNITIIDTEKNIRYSTGYMPMKVSQINTIMEKAQSALPLEYVGAMNGNGSKGMIMVKTVHSLSNGGKVLGYIMVYMDEKNFIRESYQEIYNEDQGEIFIVDEEGVIVSAENEALVVGSQYGESELFKKIKSYQRQKIPFFIEKVKGEIKLVNYEYNSKAKWYVVGLINESYINSEVNTINSEILMISLGCAFVAMLILVFISTSILRPINRLVHFTDDVLADINSAMIEDDAKDEIAYLTNRVNGMVGQIKLYMEKEQKDNVQRRQLELNMLQAQINPHFLFNTLNTIRWIANMSRVPVVSDGIASLANLLRNTIVEKNEYITIEQEVTNIKNYCFIQALKYGDSFSVSYDIEEGIKHNLILKLLLQPIVENCIIHGVGEENKIVNIFIGIKKIKNNIYIVIEDDGRGFNTQQIKSKKQLSSIGRENVEERIRLSYGEEYRMSTESETNVGTKVIIEIPSESRHEVDNV